MHACDQGTVTGRDERTTASDPGDRPVSARRGDRPPVGCEGDGESIVRHVASGKEFKFARGEGSPTALPKFTPDGKRVLLPLTRPALATVGVFIGLASWNDFLLPMLFLTRNELNTLPMGLLIFQFDNIVRQEHRFALIVMMMMPVVVVFLLLQRQFMTGLTAGAVKG